MRLRDGEADYGWISIGLHWAGAGLVLAMLFIGDSIPGPRGEIQDAPLKTHTTIGLALYGVLWARVLWRIKAGHPCPLPRQKAGFYRIGKGLHYVLVAAIAAMLLSGPVMAWTGAMPLRLFDLEIPSPLPRSPGLFALARGLHLAAANILGWGALLHVLAVVWHAAIDRDGALDRILAPPRKAGAARRS